MIQSTWLQKIQKHSEKSKNPLDQSKTIRIRNYLEDQPVNRSIIHQTTESVNQQITASYNE
jgi:hypothetical protein